MPTLLANGGPVNLWGGWSVALPAAYHQRNEDGSWSAWGADWAVDVHIIEVGGTATGSPASAREMLGAQRSVSISGLGWVGASELLVEADANGGKVYRLAAYLGAENTLMSCWVSYQNEASRPLANDLVNGVSHVPRRDA
jgi:hypothetical protein